MIPTDILDDNAAIDNDTRILEDIHLNTKNIAIYQRGTAPMKKGLAKAAQRAMEFRAIGTVEEITLSLGNHFAKVLPGHVDLMEDILHLLGLFEQVAKVYTFRVVLARVGTTMCPRFHADNNQLRMLCTYYGPGTLWLPEHAVDRKAYQNGKGNQNILLDESFVQQVDTGDVVILKGALYPDATPILHRSPNIQKNSGERLLLTIDTNEPLHLSTRPQKKRNGIRMTVKST
ncbi:MAG: DUF1826 domain-containing protein [Bacteroidota bacterium]